MRISLDGAVVFDANVLTAIRCDKISVRTFGLVKCMQDMTKRWIDISLEQQTFLATVSEYYIESRYPEDRANLSIPLTKAVAAGMLSETKEALMWIKSMLK